ncbi:TIGR03564 family F420-dependent LLM class oxidoreductase [Umezawaea sp. Da 62-37]|uniref:TIGR03564 family F420-dependent LLM class oxidoreductase n=1 Tax=Umezawaea sp. Da 62-37 TaxID=3075927 RepID=UPI0028F70D21|nr:TIGR03564 family F420-dependent LLM class oxidoreductase [Umezawaea sp. Da 62-37]WNV88104.1 TIGR03564 family F420-dependent LLM class oxidoreductase [Umezawaea sp. Da 62-37]
MRIGTGLIDPATPAEVAAAAADAARRGLDSFWTNQSPGGWDPLMLLATLGERPPEIGTAILATYPRHPVTTATEALTVQALTGGALTLGVGPSHAWYIRDQLGIPYTSPLRHTREYLSVLRPLLRGEHVRHAGEFFTVDTELGLTAPAPPLLMSALGPRMLELARELADGVVTTWVTPELIADHVVPRVGPDLRVVVQVITLLTTDPAGAREALSRDLAFVAGMPAYRASLGRAGLSDPADTVVIGDEEAVVDALARFRDAGATDVVVAPLGGPADRARTLDLVGAAALR